MIIRREEAHFLLRFRHLVLLPAVFSFSRRSVLRVFEAGSKTRNALPMPKFAARGLLHETTFRATIVGKKIVGKNRSV